LNVTGVTRDVMEPQASAYRNAIARKRSLARKSVVFVPREGIIRNHRHDEPLFALSMVA